MNTNRMKLGLVYIFSENEKLSKEAKLQLIKFIEMADEHQIKILAMDGEVIDKSSLDETARNIVDDRFKSSDVVETLRDASREAVSILTELIPAMAAGAAVGAGATYAIMQRKKVKKSCMKKFPNDTAKFQACVKDGIQGTTK